MKANVIVIAVCVKCGGHMREKVDKGAFPKTPLGRLWTYECDGCGRQRTFMSQVSPVEDAIAQMGEPAVLGAS